MEKIKLKSLLLKEFVEIPDQFTLETESKKFAQNLLDKNIISSKHKDLTTSDVKAAEYEEDIAQVVKNAVTHWVSTVNERGGR
jgi:hypothetical protein